MGRSPRRDTARLRRHSRRRHRRFTRRPNQRPRQLDRTHVSSRRGARGPRGGTFAGFKWRARVAARAAVHLAGRSIAVAAISSAASTDGEEIRPPLGLAVAGAATASLASMTCSGSRVADPPRQVRPAPHAGAGPLRGLGPRNRPGEDGRHRRGHKAATYGVARAESLLTHGMARLASASLGGPRITGRRQSPLGVSWRRVFARTASGHAHQGW